MTAGGLSLIRHVNGSMDGYLNHTSSKMSRLNALVALSHRVVSQVKFTHPLQPR